MDYGFGTLFKIEHQDYNKLWFSKVPSTVTLLLGASLTYEAEKALSDQVNLWLATEKLVKFYLCLII
jgi:hypothetical protein